MSRHATRPSSRWRRPTATPFAAAIVQGNLIATQFHPEKSQRAGLQLVRNFIELSKLEPVAAK